MKTTLEIPDALFREAKATAARRGETLKEFVNTALLAHLAARRGPKTARAGWRRVFGQITAKQAAAVDERVADFETFDPAVWK